jgi:hypothetical protein
MAMSLLAAPCPRNHDHVPIQGAFTKPSATCVDGLAEHLASFISLHLTARDIARQRFELQTCGLEDVLMNDVCTGLHWQEMDSWNWQGGSHINILESRSPLKLFRSLACRGGDVRFCYFGDSHVSRSVLASGRSSSHAFRPVLLKVGPVCIAFWTLSCWTVCPYQNQPR